MIVFVHIGQVDMAVRIADPDVILPAHLIQHLAVMRGKDQSSIAPVDALVFIEADHVFHQRLVEVVLHFIDQQIEALLLCQDSALFRFGDRVFL